MSWKGSYGSGPLDVNGALPLKFILEQFLSTDINWTEICTIQNMLFRECDQTSRNFSHLIT